MGWKVVHLSNPCKIKVKSGNLLFYFYHTGEEKKVSIEDVDFLLFDSDQFSITAQAINLLSQNSIATLFIDKSFHPSSILIPYHQHSTMTEIAHNQISITTEFRDSVWQEIITHKIANQADLLEFMGKESYIKLQELQQNVEPYDQANHEAQSARLYWRALFDNFKRNQEANDIINSMLNYSYAIIRASMARSVSASGLLPIFGIWHHNRYNSFNLVDDLIEPFRPIVDTFVKLNYNKRYSNFKMLDVNIKRDLVASLITPSVIMNGTVTSLTKSIDSFVSAYKRAVMANDSTHLIYPTINRKFFEDEFF
jgi:CRISPR-associated protein Cas1